MLVKGPAMPLHRTTHDRILGGSQSLIGILEMSFDVASLFRGVNGFGLRFAASNRLRLRIHPRVSRPPLCLGHRGSVERTDVLWE